MIEIDSNTPEIWESFYEAKWDKAILMGGRSFGKTWRGSDFSVRNIIENPYYKAQVFRDTDKQINNSILAAIKKRFYQIAEKFKENGWDLFEFFDVQDTKIRFTNRINGETVDNLTKKGFKKYQNDKVASQKGDEDIALQIFEELQDIRDEEEVNIALNTAKAKNKKAIFILNTPDLDHWIVKRYFDYEFVEEVEGEKFYKLIPKKSKTDNVLAIFGTYKDNEFVSEAVKKEYESYINPNSLEYNKHYYYKHILGFATESRQIQRKFNIRQVKTLKTVEPLATLQGLKLYKDIIPRANYVIGVDPSTGLSSDYTGFTCREFDDSYPLVAQGKLKKTPVESASLIAWLFNDITAKGGNCTVALETMEQAGGEILAYLKDLVPERSLYRARRRDPNNPQKWVRRADFGWKTTSANRSVIIAKWSLLFQQQSIQILNQDEIDEMLVFVEQEGKYQALDKKSGINQDDLLFSDFICVAVLQELYG